MWAKKVLLIGLILVLVSSTYAIVYLEENFNDYALGNLSGQNDWIGTSSETLFISEGLDGKQVSMWDGSNAVNYKENLSEITEDYWIGFNLVGDVVGVADNYAVFGRFQEQTNILLGCISGNDNLWVEDGTRTRIVIEADGCSENNNISFFVDISSGNFTVYINEVLVDTYTQCSGGSECAVVGGVASFQDSLNLGSLKMNVDNLCIATNLSECFQSDVDLVSPVDGTSYDTVTDVGFVFRLNGSDWNNSVNVTCDLNIGGSQNLSEVFEPVVVYDSDDLEDGYVVGNLSGQGTWIGTSCENISLDSGNWASISNFGSTVSNFLPVNDSLSYFVFSFDFKSNGDDSSGGNTGFGLNDGTSTTSYASFNCDAGDNLELRNGSGSYTTLVADGCISTDWLRITLIINESRSGEEIHAFVDGVDFGYFGSYSGSSVDGFRISANTGLNDNVLSFDNFCVSDNVNGGCFNEMPNPYTFSESVELINNGDYDWSVNCSQGSYDGLSDEWTVTVNPYEVLLNSPANATGYSNTADINFSFNASTDFWDNTANLTCNLSIDDVFNTSQIFEGTWSNPLNFTQIDFSPDITTVYNWSVDCSQGSDIVDGSETWFFNITTFNVLQDSPVNYTVYNETVDVQFSFNATGEWDTSSNITCSLVIDGAVNQTEEFSVGGGSASDLYDGLGVYWSLDNVTDSLGFVNLTEAGTPVWQTEASGNCKVGGCVQFDTNAVDHLVASDHDNLSGAVEMSWSYWIDPTTVDGNARGHLAKRTSASSEEDYWFFGYTSSHVYDSVGTQSHQDTGYTYDSDWQHFVWTYNGSLVGNEMKLYVDGVYIGANTWASASIPNTGSDLRIGTLWNSGSYPYSFLGYFDEIGIWKGVVLNTSQISDLYNNGSGRDWDYISQGDSSPWVNPLNFSENVTFVQSGGTQVVNWSVNCSQGVNTGETLANYTFNVTGIFDDFRAEEINLNNLSFNWSYGEEVNITVVGESEYVGDDENLTVVGLLEDTEYNVSWVAGENNGSVLIETDGWHDDLADYTYRRLVNVTDVDEDKELYAVSLSLTEDNFVYVDEESGFDVPSFSLLNWSDLTDLRFVDFYDVEFLKFNVSSSDINGDGCVNVDISSDAQGFVNINNSDNAFDEDWGTTAYTEDFGSIYLNWTKPANTVDAHYKIRTGSPVYDYLEVPSDCFDESVLQFKIDLNDTGAGYVDTQCFNGSGWESINNETSGYYFYESEVKWIFDCELNVSVVPLHFTAENQTYSEGVDGDYVTKFWFYYGKQDESVSNESAVLGELGNWSNYSMSDQMVAGVFLPVISNVLNFTGEDYTWFNISWDVNKVANNTIVYATNPWLLNASNETLNGTADVYFNITGLTSNITYYWMAVSEDQNLNNDSVFGSITLGDSAVVPVVEWLNYTEHRENETVTVCANLTDLSGYAGVNVSFEYFNLSDVTFGETVAYEFSGVGEFCENVSAGYGFNFTYRGKGCVGAFCGYSNSFTNEYLSVQEFFAGSVVEDDMDYKSRQFCYPNVDGTVNLSVCYEQTGVREGSMQEESSIWIETNVSTSGLNVSWWNGGAWVEYVMSNNSEFSYVEITGLNSSWQTFYIHNESGDVVLNWTKPSETHDYGSTRVDASKYVSFNNTPAEIDYQLLYVQGKGRYITSYQYCSNAGGSQCWNSPYWGYHPTENSTYVGTDYDRGEFFRGGVRDAGVDDAGLLNDFETTENLTLGDLNRISCFIFQVAYYNSDTLPSNNITNYYYRYWNYNKSDSLSDHDFWYSCLTRFDDLEQDVDDSSESGNPDGVVSGYDSWQCIEGTKLEVQAIHQIEPKSTFNAMLTDSGTDVFGLVYGFKDGFEVWTGNDTIYDIAFKQQVKYYGSIYANRFQPAFVIFNLPDNATLQGLDSDGDSLSDFDELWVYFTNPKDADTDNDGEDDDYEISEGTDPNLYTSHEVCNYIGDYNASSGNWSFDCGECNITESVNLNNFEVFINGSGSMLWNGSVFNYSNFHIEGINETDVCVLRMENGTI